MATQTITYSDNASGWTSFWSYYPDWMIGLSSVFYSWKNGSLFKHNNATRNNFYGIPCDSIIKTIFNEDSSSVKMFKTVGLDSTSPWETTLFTDLDTGKIYSNEYSEKEGGYFGFIRSSGTNTNSNSLLSTQGIGNTAPASAGGSTATFSFNITTRVNTNDLVYFNNAPIGPVISSTPNTITVTGAFPAGVGYVYIQKNSIAESLGLRGYYMDVILKAQATTEIELFSVSSSLFKSYL